MAAKLLLFLAVMKLASSNPMPEPDPNINVKVEVNVYDNNNGKAGLSCTFGDTCYANGDYLKDTCFILKCCNGNWTYTGKDPRPECEKCLAYGDPHITTYDQHANLPNTSYLAIDYGELALTQTGKANKPLFGVNIKTVPCDCHLVWWPISVVCKSCIQSMTYSEPGITVEVVVPDFDCVSPTTPSTPITIGCEMELLVNNESRPIPHGGKVDSCCTPYGGKVDRYQGTEGTVLVFHQNHMNGIAGFNCISVVGSKGLSMALCDYYKGWPWFHVYAMPSLKSPPTSTSLYGLCDTYTGTTRPDYTLRDGAVSIYPGNGFVNSWKVV